MPYLFVSFHTLFLTIPPKNEKKLWFIQASFLDLPSNLVYVSYSEKGIQTNYHPCSSGNEAAKRKNFYAYRL